MTAANSYANGASVSSAVTSAGYTGSYSADTWTIYSGFNITINAGLYAYEIPDTSALLSSSYNVGGIYYYYASATDLHEFFYIAGTNTASKSLRLYGTKFCCRQQNFFCCLQQILYANLQYNTLNNLPI
jgi:hypothetical protein